MCVSVSVSVCLSVCVDCNDRPHQRMIHDYSCTVTSLYYELYGVTRTELQLKNHLQVQTVHIHINTHTHIDTFCHYSAFN